MTSGHPAAGPQDDPDPAAYERTAGDVAQLLRSTLDGLTSHVAVVDETGEILLTNKAYRDFADLNGVAAVSVSERVNYLAVCDAAQGTDAAYAHQFAQGLREVIAGERAVFELEYPCDAPDEARWFLVRVTLLAGDDPRRAVVAHENITQRKLAEESLRLQVQRAEALLAIPALADGCDEKTFMQRGMELAEDLTGSRISFVHLINEGGAEIELVAWSRRTLEHYCTANYDSHYPVNRAGIWADAVRRARPVIVNDYASHPHKLGLPEGHSPLQRLISVPVIEDGRVVLLAGVGNKATDYTLFDSESVQLLATAIWQIVRQRRTEEATREAQARIDRLARHVPGGLYQFQMLPDGTTRVPYASGGISDVYGVTPAQLSADATDLFAVIHPDDSAPLLQSIQESARTLDPWRNLHRVLRPDGRTVWIEGEATPEAQPDGSVLWHGYVRDVTQRMETEAVLRQLTRAVEQSDVTIVITDRDGNIEYANPYFEVSSGYTVQEVRGKNPRILQAGDTPRATYLALWEALLAGAEWRGELHNKRKDGSTYWESVVISPVRDATGTTTNYVAVKEDISERKRAESERAKLQAQLNHAQKMQSVGRLAGGIAHDFNNLLTVINGTVELALSSQDPSDPYHADFVAIQEAAQRATALTRQLLAFSRQNAVQLRDVPINEALTQMLGMLRRMVGADVGIATDMAGDAGLVRVDVGQLEQVITNLMVNARDAMPQGGRITVSTARETVAEGTSAVAPAGDYVRITVRDTGVGMSAEVQDHLFEPFFTTKSVGKGTGLGLAIVYGIVRQSGGTITVESAIGVGTAFHVLLPRLAQLEHTAEPSEPATMARGSGVILVVDDEPALGKITERVLQRAGYTVLLAHSGGEALRIAAEHPGTIDLLLSDVIMPEMSGPEVAAALRAKDPTLRVMFVSGHSGEILTNHGLTETAYDFIAKPFSIVDLTQKVQGLLTRGAPPQSS
jgi:two-component system cell cycle sensor histidine kinase/response regulator CckA